MTQHQFQPGEVQPDEYYKSASLDLIIDLFEKGEFAHAKHLALELLARAETCKRREILMQVFDSLLLLRD